jgi:hypothetical protein
MREQRTRPIRHLNDLPVVAHRTKTTDKLQGGCHGRLPT